MSQPNNAPKVDSGWKRVSSTQEPTGQELLAEELEGERIRQSFQSEINANYERKSYGENPITLLTSTYPALSSFGGKGMSRTFSRNIEACKANPSLTAIYSERQLIALAAANTLAPVLDWPPGKLHQLHAVCCRIGKTNPPEKAYRSN